jgi:hypothetical protein
MNASKLRVIQQFNERVSRDELTSDIEITYRVTGGMPDESIEEEFTLSGNARAHVVSADPRQSKLQRKVSAKLDRGEARALFELAGKGFADLATRPAQRFLPDSTVGSITIRIGNEEAEVCFLTDEDQRVDQGKPISPELASAIERFGMISKRLLAYAGGLR